MDLKRIYLDSNDQKCNILEMVKREPEWAANWLQEGEKAIEQIERMQAEIVEFKAAADPFVRATRIQDPLKLSDKEPVRNWIPGAWPTMKDARRLVKAVEA